MRLVSLLAVAVVLVACGGKTDSDPDAGACPSNVPEGLACSTPNQVCAIPGVACDGVEPSCTCLDGAWACTLVDCPSPPACGDGVSCNSGDHCEIPVSDCGFDATMSCTCLNGSYVCVSPDCPVQPGCPPPDTIQPGAACGNTGPEELCTSALPIYDCQGNVTGAEQCACADGVWQCDEQSPPCDGGTVVDAGAPDQ